MTKSFLSVAFATALMGLVADGQQQQGSVAVSGTSSDTSAPELAVFPVQYSPNGRYLVDQNGVPFPINGRTAWFITSLSVADYRTFIDDTAARGYSAIEFHVVNHDDRGNHPPLNGSGVAPFLNRLDGTSWDGSLSGSAPDFTTPNESFWTGVDGLLSYCESKGLLVFMFPAYVGFMGGEQGWMQEIVANGPAKMQTYGAWIATRYRDQKNIIWMMGGDMGTAPNVFNSAQTAVEDGLITGLKSVTGQQSTLFSAEWDSESIGTDQTSFGTQMTLNCEYSHGGDVNTQGRRAYAHTPVEPSFMVEGPYDQEGLDGNGWNEAATQPVRRFEWWAWLSTIGGYIVGNGYVWPFNAPDWQNHLDTQCTRDLTRLNAFMRSIAWYDLVPSGLDGMRTLITAGNSSVSSTSYVAATATQDGTLLVAYIPPDHSGSITVDMGAMSGPSQARWFDPTSAAYVSIGTALPNSGTRVFTPPGNNSAGQSDWVLTIQTTAVPPTATPSPIPTATVAPTSTPTFTLTPTPAPNPTPTPAPTATPLPTLTPTPTPTAVPTATPTPAPTTGLVAAYNLNEGSGTTITDLSGHGLTGTIISSTWTAGGRHGNALSFNGSSSYVDLGNPASLQITGSMTWSAWVKATANPVDDGQIISKSDGVSGWQLKTSPDTGPHTFAVAVSSGVNTRTQRYSTTVRLLNVWYHVAGVYNAATKTLDIFVNGVLDNGSVTGSIPASQVNSAANVNIGRRTGGLYFNGIVDDVRIYNRAQSQAEIQADMITPIALPTATPTPTTAPTPTATPAPTATAAPTATPTATPAPINISGSVSYCSNPVPGPVPNVTFTLTGNSSGTAQSDASGDYQLSSLTSGGSYTVTPTKAALAPGSPGIDTIDVIATQQHYLNVAPLPPGCRQSAADVNGDNTIDTYDVVGIQRFYLGKTSAYANVGKYRFTPASRTYPGISSGQTAQDYDALVSGDVISGFVYRPENPSQTGSSEGASSDEAAPTVLAVSLPEVAVDTAMTNFIVPVTTTAINPVDKLVGFQGDFTFDERVVSFESEPVQKAGITAGNWNVSGNVLPGVGPIRTLRISAFSNDLVPLSGSGTLFELRMTRVSQAAQGTQLLWATSPNQFLFIDSDLKTQSPANAVPGSVTPSGKRH